MVEMRHEGLGLSVVEGRCTNGHLVRGEMAWLLDLDFFEDQYTAGKCPVCGAETFVLAGHYEPQGDGIWRRVGQGRAQQ